MLSREIILRRIIETKREYERATSTHNVAAACILSERLATYREVLQDEKDNSVPVPVVRTVHFPDTGTGTECTCPSPGYRADRPNCGNHGGAQRRISDEEALQKGMEIMQRVRDKFGKGGWINGCTPLADAQENARRYRENAESLPCESPGFQR